MFWGNHTTRLRRPGHGAGIALILSAIGLAGCSSGGSGGGGAAPTTDTPEVSTEIVYERNRDAGGLIAPVLAESGGGFDAAEVDSPEVAVDSGRPGGDRFLLYYEATDGGGVTSIGAVTSDEEDLVPLAIGRTQVVVPTMGTAYSFAATDPTVVVDKRAAENPARRYKMWFEGRSGVSGTISTIVYCFSADGITWSGFTPVLGLDASFATLRVADPTVVLDDDTFRMWFEAVDAASGSSDGPGTIGYADSTDGVNWTIRDAAGNTGLAAGPVYQVGPEGNFDGYSVNSPSVVLDEAIPAGLQGRFKMWYEAGDQASDTENSIGYVTSSNGLVWGNPTLPILIPSSDSISPLPFDSGDLEHPSAVIIDSIPEGTVGHFLLYYTGDGENGASPNRIGLASGRVGP